jgi:hypothetical protein
MREASNARMIAAQLVTRQDGRWRGKRRFNTENTEAGARRAQRKKADQELKIQRFNGIRNGDKL